MGLEADFSLGLLVRKVNPELSLGKLKAENPAELYYIQLSDLKKPE